jgi:hypothetical protein
LDRFGPEVLESIGLDADIKIAYRLPDSAPFEAMKKPSHARAERGLRAYRCTWHINMFLETYRVN